MTKLPAYLICIEGNIGVGKTTLAKALGEKLKVPVVFEPVAENPYLELFYKDPKRYALEMQFWLMTERFKMHQSAIETIWKTGYPVIMDRSIYGDGVFANANHQRGNITDAGIQCYLEHRKVMERFLLPPQLVVSLGAHPTLCLSRIRERGRECEKDIDLSYLCTLSHFHEELMVEMREMGSNVLQFEAKDLSLESQVEYLAGYLLGAGVFDEK